MGSEKLDMISESVPKADDCHKIRAQLLHTVRYHNSMSIFAIFEIRDVKKIMIISLTFGTVI